MKFPTLRIIAISSILLSFTAKAQDSGIGIRSRFLSTNGIANPASPEASAMVKYGNHSMDLYSGTMRFSIPFFTYSDDDFSIPISFDYSYSGYKPNIQTGTMGMGWTLNVGGAITRQVNGIMDDGPSDLEIYDFKSKFIGSNSVLSQTNKGVNGYAYYCKDSTLNRFNTYADHVYSAKAGEEYMPVISRTDDLFTAYEQEPDVFSFNMPGHSGSFVLEKGGGALFFNTSGPSACYSLNYTLMRQGITSFVIKTPDCYSFEFALVEQAYSISSIGSENGVSTPGSWRLTNIVAPNGRRVNYSYLLTSYAQTMSPEYIRDHIEKKSYDELHDVSEDASSIEESYISKTYVETYCPTDISTSDSTVHIHFSYSSKRLELNALPYSCLKIDSIKVSSSYGEVKSCAFRYRMDEDQKGTEYGSKAYGITFLDRLKIPGTGEYIFDYDDRDFLPSSPAINTFGIDWYGYWQPVTTEASFSPSLAEARIDNTYLNTYRQSDFTHSKFGALKEVIYPTGGKTTFEYEANDFSQDLTGFLTGEYSRIVTAGVRIKSAHNYDEKGNDIQRTDYIYENEDGKSSGRLLWRPMIYSKYEGTSSGFWRIRRETSSTASDFPFSKDSHIEYLRTVEKTYSPSDNSKCSIIVSRYQGADCALGRNDYSSFNSSYQDPDSFSLILSPSDRNSEAILRLPATEQSLFKGKPLSVTTYSDTVAHPVSSTEYSYDYCDVGCYVSTVMKLGYQAHYYMDFYPPYLEKEKRMVYGTDGELISWKRDSTSLDNLFRKSSMTRTQSGGDTLATKYDYFAPVPVYLTEERTERNGKPSDAKRYGYVHKGGNFYLADNLSSAIIGPDDIGWDDIRYDTDVTIDQYDALGHPLQSTDKTGKHTVYIWGYGGLYPVAKVENATYSAVSSSGEVNDVYPGALPADSESYLRGLDGCLTTTYEYRPLIGLTVIKDNSGKSTFYRYDHFGRLLDITDSRNEILKAFEYEILTDNDNNR